ncbi:hypothetical protein CBL_10179 [Carabus blaptoides fortunei]
MSSVLLICSHTSSHTYILIGQKHRCRFLIGWIHVCRFYFVEPALWSKIKPIQLDHQRRISTTLVAVSEQLSIETCTGQTLPSDPGSHTGQKLPSDCVNVQSTVQCSSSLLCPNDENHLRMCSKQMGQTQPSDYQTVKSARRCKSRIFTKGLYAVIKLLLSNYCPVIGPILFDTSYDWAQLSRFTKVKCTRQFGARQIHWLMFQDIGTGQTLPSDYNNVSQLSLWSIQFIHTTSSPKKKIFELEALFRLHLDNYPGEDRWF